MFEDENFETDLTSLSEFCVTGISQKIWCEYTLTSLTKCVISRNEGNSQSENPFCTPTSRGLYTDDLQVCRARPPCIKELEGFISDDDDVVSIISISSEDERVSSTYSKEPKQELCKPFDLMYPVKGNIEQLPETLKK
ncbi:hypothetical protein RN001_001965 [Aquatica leii]|uniref:Uncharacterized protein n=1 Tax=Aquatica leii TaxID=1421715 RepID=A0AAN7Q4R3_9COLE|nr:hypothetical protein RN001_001965 [Aquatica leii]